ncbi:MAG: alpha/beta hydrolase [Verrucomicrobia bacterium]|nr:alpha/beta hydrolase [Verrucomicrobiota bacterium]
MQYDYPDFRIYGSSPYEIVLVHGGPGAPGELAPVAQKLSEWKGTLEHLQKQLSIEEQVTDLQRVIVENCQPPVTLIGWSWGAMLSFIFTSKHPASVKKLILISSGPFESSYADNIMSTRLARLEERERIAVEELFKNISSHPDNLKKIAKIFFHTDSYSATVNESPVLACQDEVYQKVWAEAARLRKSGELLAYGSSIKCPVVAIHGDHDPRPCEGVRAPLARVLKNFRAILLPHCGHYLWYEAEASAQFYEILRQEIYGS